MLQAGDGDAALELLRRRTGPIDLLVTDVVMPGMSGRELAGAVGRAAPRAHVLYISGYTDDVVVRHGMLERGDRVPAEAVHPDVLAHKVREVLDGAPNSVAGEAGTELKV